MPDEMFFSADERALVRGRRAAGRTETCRPCVLTLTNGRTLQGVILNLNAHGVLVRLMEPVEIGTVMNVQMMRDEAFSKPMSPPRVGKVIRLDGSDGTFYDVAIKLAVNRIEGRRAPTPRAPRANASPVFRPAASRMQNLDITLGDTRRGGRGRG